MSKKRVLALFLGLTLGLSCLMLPVAAGGEVPTVTARKTGAVVTQNGKAKVDRSNLAEGYLLLSYLGKSKVRTRVQITKTGGTAYLYELSNSGTAEVYPLTEGDGTYAVKVYEQVPSGKYATAYSCTVDFKARNEFLPFLYPNQYVNYSTASQVVGVAATLTKDCKTDMEKVSAVYSYVVDSFTYDDALAKTVQSGYLPVVDTVLQNKKGICLDYAAVMTAMLRSQNVPCKLVVGYAGNIYHAWINVYLEGKGWVDKAIYFDGEHWTLMDPTFVSSGARSEKIMKYVTNRENYTQKFAY